MRKILDILFLPYHLYEITGFRNQKWSNLIYNVKEYKSEIYIGYYEDIIPEKQLFYWVTLNKKDSKVSVTHCFGIISRFVFGDRMFTLRDVITNYHDEAITLINNMMKKYDLPEKQICIRKIIDENMNINEDPIIYQEKQENESSKTIINKINSLISNKIDKLLIF